MKSFVWILITCLAGCSTGDTPGIEVIKVDQSKIDSIVNQSDSVAIESIHGEKFSTMYTYFQDDTDISVRILKDSVNNVRAIVLMKNGHYKQSKQYFANGQLKGKLHYARLGVLDGPATYYYKNGRIRTKGAFDHNYKTGEWKYYDKGGNLDYVEVYDNKGNLKNSRGK